MILQMSSFKKYQLSIATVDAEIESEIINDIAISALKSSPSILVPCNSLSNYELCIIKLLHIYRETPFGPK